MLSLVLSCAPWLDDLNIIASSEILYREMELAFWKSEEEKSSEHGKTRNDQRIRWNGEPSKESSKPLHNMSFRLLYVLFSLQTGTVTEPPRIKANQELKLKLEMKKLKCLDLITSFFPFRFFKLENSLKRRKKTESSMIKIFFFRVLPRREYNEASPSRSCYESKSMSDEG